MGVIRKAVFPVAGMGTRFLPATKAMPKELLPIIDKPIIQYAVEEAVAAGITELIFITGRTKRAIEDHLDANPELEALLRQTGHEDLAHSVRYIVPSGINCMFIRQPQPLGLGHAVLCAKPVIGDEPFAVILADDVISGRLALPDMIAAYEQSPASYLCSMEVSPHETHRYGILVPGTGRQVAGLVEKPPLGKAPSLQASIGRYVLEPRVLDLLERQTAGVNGEIQLADAIASYCRVGRVMAYPLQGRRYDCGSKLGYLEAIVDFALQREEFAEDFTRLLQQRAALLPALR